jgi:hypothetical protein
MNDEDPVLLQLRALPSLETSDEVRARTLRAAEGALRVASRSSPARSAWLVPALLFVCETIYLIDVMGKIRLLFG